MDDQVFGPRVVRGRCRCEVCGQEIFPADAAPSRYAEPVDVWVHYIEPEPEHDVVFGYWLEGPRGSGAAGGGRGH